jgi:hypothetical protein
MSRTNLAMPGYFPNKNPEIERFEIIEETDHTWGDGSRSYVNAKMLEPQDVASVPYKAIDFYAYVQQLDGTVPDIGAKVHAVWKSDVKRWEILSTDTNFRIAKSTVQIPARVGSVPGSASVQPQKIDSGLLVDDGDPVTVYSWVKYASQTPAPSFYLAMTRDRNGIWWFTGEDCP